MNLIKEVWNYCALQRSVKFHSLLVSSLLVCYPCKPKEAATGGDLKKFAKLTGKHLCRSLFFNKTETFLRQRLRHSCIPVNFAKFLKAPFLQNTSGCFWTKCYSLIAKTAGRKESQNLFKVFPLTWFIHTLLFALWSGWKYSRKNTWILWAHTVFVILQASATGRSVWGYLRCITPPHCYNC